MPPCNDRHALAHPPIPVQFSAMHIATSPAFKENAHHALADAGLQKALARSGPSFIARRTAAVAALPEFEQLRDNARDIKNHALANLDFYLETYEAKVCSPAARCTGARRRRSARCGAGDLPGGECAHRDQGQVDDQRGDGHQRPPGDATASLRSKPTSANTLFSCAMRCPATSLRRRSISTWRIGRTASANPTPTCRPTACSMNAATS